MNSNINENESSINTDTQVIVTDEKHSSVTTELQVTVTNEQTNQLTDVQKSTTIELSTESHDKVLKFLINELNLLKESNSEKDLHIQNLNDKVVELTNTIEDLEIKLNKKDNLGLLLKLKENLTKKQCVISNEIDHEIETNTKITETNELSLSVEDKKLNVIIDDESPILKPKKKPAVFRRRF